jgi:ABC-2 type transport system ATP-binding protein
MAELPDTAIKVEGVYKNFRLPHERNATLKSTIINSIRGKKGRIITTQHALKDISFEIKKGEFFGIVGRNGSGKSTLLKIIAGIYQPTKGNIAVNGKLVPFIELGVGFNPELTGRENIYLNGALLGFSTEEIDAFYDEVVEFAELEDFMDQRLKNYSSGMQVRLAFSMAIRAEADILLVDEVLAVGDADFQRKCFEYFRYLKKQKTTVIFVSHDMNSVREYCDRAILIENSQIISAGTPEKISGLYAKLFMKENKHEEISPSKIRWGTKLLEFEEITCSPEKITEEDLTIQIICKIKVNEPLDEPILGFSIKNMADMRILGTNTKLQGIKIKDLKAGQHFTLVWTIPNILNDGDYLVNAAIESKSAVASDWWEEALRFSVYRPSKKGFIVHPKIEIEVKR